MAAITTAWIDKNDLIEAFGIRDLPIDDAGDVSDDKINTSIDISILFIESYMRSVGITLPLAESVQSELKECLLNITRYNYSNNEAAMTDEIRLRYQDCIAYLNKVLKGSIVLTDTGTSAGWSNMQLFRC